MLNYLNDAGTMFWHSLLPDNYKVSFIRLDNWLNPLAINEDIQNIGNDTRIVVLLTTYHNSTSKVNFQHAFEAVFKQLTEQGLQQHHGLQYSLRVHFTQPNFQNAFVFTHDQSARIPARLKCSTVVHGAYNQLRLTKLIVRKTLKWRKTQAIEKQINEVRNRWRERAHEKMIKEFQFGETNKPRDERMSLTVGAFDYTFFNPIHYRRLPKTPTALHSTFFSLGGHEEVAFCVARNNAIHPKLDIELNSDDSRIVISTLCFNDFMFIPQWVDHYRKYGVSHFLIYYNGWSLPELLLALDKTNSDITAIPWGFEYSHIDSSAGKKNYHVAQPMQLHHSCLLSRKLNLGSHLLYVDVDEFIIGNGPLSDNITSQTHEISFANVWSSCEDISSPTAFNTFVQEQLDLTIPARKKSLRRLNVVGKWNIHGSPDISTYSNTHIMLHFGDLLNSKGESSFFPRSTDYIKRLKRISDLSQESKLRKIWETRL